MGMLAISIPRSRDQQSRLIDSLRSAPELRATRPFACCLCGGVIEVGDRYRDRRFARRAHVGCWRQVEKELNGS